ncbi:hypothetical protein JK386_11905 [Nocardioides sp. zg-536]|uniref:Uncharacterized protein n=1 Tax=Nocardioides faecalis TaxID=2803858 RepID=A0A938YB51_9ACTN|nr:hypothetical protein [Nocardioides faecalis]MBM9460609.1 hypothetical protein [Nocardioides faecalis]MBS4754328.1 hypothetical protein [Nocardioides faecalis]QVI57470.1 hypothetical protein KG111_10165 [Nocardioides faecalis]
MSKGPTDDDRSRTRLNITLYAATVLLACLAVALGVLIYDARGEQIDGVDVVPGAGQDVGRGIVQAVPAADADEQERTAAQLKAASEMVTSFVNFDHKEPDRTINAVQERSTGEFLKQYNEGVSGLKELAAEAQSTMQASVVWSGLVAGDDDSATVIVATTGSVTNKTTEFKKEARNYRIQVELVLEKGRWLTSDLQYVELG